MQLNWLEHYYQQAHREANGRTYERLGLRWCYCFVARFFGEAVLPDTRTIQSDSHPKTQLSHANLNRMYHATRYYEIVNLLYGTFTLPLIYFVAVYGNEWLLYYAYLFVLMHLLTTLQERYKRCLCYLLLQKPQVCDTKEASLSPPLAKTLGRAAGWFRLARFETVGFYRCLGVERFRQVVLEITTGTAVETQQRTQGQRHIYIQGRSLSHIHAYEQQTQTAEASHLIGVLLHTPFLWHFVEVRFWMGVGYIALFMLANVYCVLLQRYHRVRIARILQKAGDSR